MATIALLTRLRCSNVHRLSYSVPRLFLTPQKITRQPPRNFFLFPKKSPEEYKILDNVPDEYKLIYHNRMEKYIIAGQISLALCTVILLITVSTIEDFSNIDLHYEEWTSTTKQSANEGVIYISCFVIFAIIVHIFLSRCTFRIYKRPGSNQYVMINPGNLPFLRERVSFKREQISLLEASGVMPWRESRYLISLENASNKRVLLLDNFFRVPADMNIMLGIQRDPDTDESKPV